MTTEQQDPIPGEFHPDFVAEHSPETVHEFRPFLRSGEPLKSLFEANPWLSPPSLKQPLEWGAGHYWDTTVASRHPYWRSKPLPEPAKDIRTLRQNFHEWGYCLIKDGLSATQCKTFLARLHAQAEGEARAGIAQMTPTGQYVNTLINKGRCFVGCIEQDPAYVQAGPLIVQLLNETLGKGWICHSFLANGADPGGYPQGLHIDQGPMLPFMTAEAPALVNTMFIPQAVDEHNGGTLVIPGSHRLLAAAGSGGTLGEVPPAINLEAPAGTIMVFDGRLLHGTGVNRSDKRRFVATMSNVKSWMRTQENWVLSVRPEVLEAASPILLHRIGLQALVHGSTVEGFGLGAPGRVGDAWGAIKQFRTAADAGAYLRVGELSGESTEEELGRDYTVRKAMARARNARTREARGD